MHLFLPTSLFLSFIDLCVSLFFFSLSLSLSFSLLFYSFAPLVGSLNKVAERGVEREQQGTFKLHHLSGLDGQVCSESQVKR